MNVDNEKIRSVCDGLLRDYQIRDEAITNLTRLVRKTVDRPAPHRPHRDTAAAHPMVPPDLIDADSNLPHVAGPPLRSQPATLTPYIPVREHAPCHMSTPPPIQPSCVEVPDRHVYRASHESRQGYRAAAPIQRFNNKTLNWPSWFRHFKAVADVHGWDKDQRALQLVSYLDETTMNVTQELADDELYDYDILVKLLGDWFDPASRVSATRSRFHGRNRRHHEDTDVHIDLCHVVTLQLGPATTIGDDFPSSGRALALCEKPLASTLTLQQKDYWEEINPLLAKWKNVNDSRCPECDRSIRVNNGSTPPAVPNNLCVLLEVPGLHVYVMVHVGAQRQGSYREDPPVS